MLRQPIVAGQFYDAAPAKCRRQATACIPDQANVPDQPFQAIGGIVPHAGWTYSGKIGGRVFRALATDVRPQTVVLCGAMHAARRRTAAVYDRGAWQTPLGRVAVDEALAALLLTHCDLAAADLGAHRLEHSLEVQIPFVQVLFPSATILPVMVPPVAEATPIGVALGQVIRRSGVAVAVLGTSDLTHYGPRYGMTSHGIGAEGLDWARQVNDRRMIDRILALDAAGVVQEAAKHHNACGSGAVAATIAACGELGAIRAVLLEHTTSREMCPAGAAAHVADAVGYAGILFGK